METLVGLQPNVASSAGESTEAKLARQCTELLEQVPPPFNMRELKVKIEQRGDPDAMKTVLYQELERYNVLLGKLHKTLSDITKAVAGLVAVTSELEDVMAALSSYRLPAAWSKVYPSAKPLGSWMRDLLVRCDQLREWSEVCMPNVFWLPGFTYPTGFLTAVLQTSARANGVAIDQLGWEFPVLNHGDKSEIAAPPKEGVYVSGFFLEGASWNFESGYLEEPKPMELIATMPIIHFKPVEGKKKAAKGYYTCPVYMYPVRTGTRERPSFVVACDIKSGKFSADFWTKRGVAILLATSQ